MPSNETGNAPKGSDEPSTNNSNDYGLRLEDQQNDFVLDFLYHDAPRVASFLAQFGTYGVPQQSKTGEFAKRSSATKTGGSAGIDVPIVAKGQASVEYTVTDDTQQSAETTWDPLWANARKLLDFLEERDLIQRDIWKARVGQFVLAKGALIFLDLAMLKQAWEKPSIKKQVMSGVPSGGKARQEALKKIGVPPDFEFQFLFDLLSIMPHSLQATVLSDQGGVWCCLSEQHLVGLASDLLLKHGAFIPGEWSILGALDATMDPQRVPSPGEPATRSLDDLVADLVPTVVGKLAAQMAPVARNMMGRPRDTFGVTPILIFREVSPSPPVSSIPSEGRQE